MRADRKHLIVGRVGGLAVALGIGTAVATGAAGTAWADDDGSASTRSSSSDASSETVSSETGSSDSGSGSGESKYARTSRDDAPTETSKPEGEEPDRAEDADNAEEPDAEQADTEATERPTKVRAARASLVRRDLVTPAETPVSPTNDTAPVEPDASAGLWSLLGSARRDTDPEAAAVVAEPVTTTQPGQAPTEQPPTAAVASDVATVEDGTEWESLYTGEPSWLHNVVTAGLSVLKVILKPFGGLLRYTSLKIPIFTDGIPPFFVRRGLDVERTEFEGMKVWSLTPRNEATDKVVVALHGGSYEGQVNVFQWSTYADMARDTGATVVVPLYSLAPEGTAATEVPRTANYITTLIDAHDAENVSVLGDSAGGGLALAAAQELARRNSRQPSRLVLLAPWLDVSMSDPRSAEIDDPLLDIPNLARPGAQWAGAAGPADPMASPLFGELQGLPPMYVYSSSRDLLTVDTLRLRDRVLAEGIPDVTFRLRAGLIHDWLIFPFLPDAHEERPSIYADLLGADEPSATPLGA